VSASRHRIPLITAIDLYFLTVIALIKGGALLSSGRGRLFLARFVAFIGYRLSQTKRQLSEDNVAQAFGGELTKDLTRTIVRSSFYQFWCEAFSMPSPSSSEPGCVQVSIRGLEHLQFARDNGKGAILWESAVFGRRLLAKQILHQNGFSVHQVHGENHAGGFYTPCPASWLRRRVIKRFFDNCEKQYVAEILNLPLWEPLPVMRALLERLKQNRVICVAGDGTLGWNWVRKRFLWRERGFSTGMVSLSKITGAPILPFFCIQESADKIALIIERPIGMDATMDRNTTSEMCIEQYVRLLESYVRKHPGQYYGWGSCDAPGAESNQATETDDSPVTINARLHATDAPSDR
jgi:lauroyl/myristoyl acyltransferase